MKGISVQGGKKSLSVAVLHLRFDCNWFQGRRKFFLFALHSARYKDETFSRKHRSQNGKEVSQKCEFNTVD